MIDLSRMRGATSIPSGGLPACAAARCSPSSTTPPRRTGSSARSASSLTLAWRPDAGRRDGSAAAQARSDDRQPACGRARDRRRPGRAGERGRESRALLGHARGGRELRDRDVVRVPLHPFEGRSRMARSPIRSSGPRSWPSATASPWRTGRRAVDVLGMAAAGNARGPVASVSVLHSGSPADAERDFAGLRALDDPLEDESSRSRTWRRSACSTRRWSGDSASP